MAKVPILYHFDPKPPITLTCDASARGIGAVLKHHFLDCMERPIAFTPRMLTKAEKAYSQLEKKALVVVSAVRKSYCYLYGQHLTLQRILGLRTDISVTAAARLQQWTCLLAANRYIIVYEPSKENVMDWLSRVPENSRTQDMQQNAEYTTSP